MTDTTRFDMLGCYGNPDMHTPNLDAMAADGLRFERAYTCQPVCGPARSALFTGMFPHSNGSWGNSLPLYEGVLTLGQRLSRGDILCGYIGKWHLDAGDYFGSGVCPDGWAPECWYDMKNYLDELTEGERLRSRNGSNRAVDAEFTFGHRCTKRALEFIRRHKDEDFFLVLSYDEPHDPSLCPEPYASMYDDYEWPRAAAHDDTLENKPDYQRLWAGRGSRKQPGLLACNAYIDSEIGRVIKEIDKTAPDAMAMFTSDHGDAIGAHRLSGKGPCVYDEIARVPLIFRGKTVPRGVLYTHTVSHIDLPATVMDYMGRTRPAVFAGCSLLPILSDPSALKDRPAYVEFTRYEIDHDGFGGFQPMRAAISDRYKLAIHLLDTDEMYDIQNDPYNMHNLICDIVYAKERDALHDAIINRMNDTRDPFRGYQWQARPWRKDKHASFSVDGYTRQRENEPGEYRQLDYNTGLTMETATRKK